VAYGGRQVLVWQSAVVIVWQSVEWSIACHGCCGRDDDGCGDSDDGDGDGDGDDGRDDDMIDGCGGGGVLGVNMNRKDMLGGVQHNRFLERQPWEKKTKSQHLNLIAGWVCEKNLVSMVCFVSFFVVVDVAFVWWCKG